MANALTPHTWQIEQWIDISGFQSDCVLTLPLVTSLRLPVPGTYSVRAIYNGPNGVVIGPLTTFEVTLAPEQVPVISGPLLLALAITLLVIGLGTLGGNR